jgi:two-component system chemotaxis sensor kinase CheA
METRRLDHGDADADTPTPRYRVDDVDLPLVSLRRHLGLPPATAPGHVVIVRGAHGPTALQVDACLAQRDVVVKPLPRVRGADPVAGGATLLGDGTPALLLDPAAL